MTRLLFLCSVVTTLLLASSCSDSPSNPNTTTAAKFVFTEINLSNNDINYRDVFSGDTNVSALGKTHVSSYTFDKQPSYISFEDNGDVSLILKSYTYYFGRDYWATLPVRSQQDVGQTLLDTQYVIENINVHRIVSYNASYQGTESITVNASPLSCIRTSYTLHDSSYREPIAPGSTPYARVTLTTFNSWYSPDLKYITRYRRAQVTTSSLGPEITGDSTLSVMSEARN